MVNVALRIRQDGGNLFVSFAADDFCCRACQGDEVSHLRAVLHALRAVLSSAASLVKHTPWRADECVSPFTDCLRRFPSASTPKATETPARVRGAALANRPSGLFGRAGRGRCALMFRSTPLKRLCLQSQWRS